MRHFCVSSVISIFQRYSTNVLYTFVRIFFFSLVLVLYLKTNVEKVIRLNLLEFEMILRYVFFAPRNEAIFQLNNLYE